MAHCMGLAVDIGTTTVALRLYDLESARLLATNRLRIRSASAAPISWRASTMTEQHGGRLLQRTLLGYLTRAHRSAARESLRTSTRLWWPEILRCVISSSDSTCRASASSRIARLRKSRYREGLASTTPLSIPARKLRLPVHPEARVYGLPLVGSHVGADAAACLLATGIADGDDVCALLDIGTNTEAFLGNRAPFARRFLSCRPRV